MSRLPLFYSMASSQPRDWNCLSCVSCITGGFFTIWAIREAPPPKKKTMAIVKQKRPAVETYLSWKQFIGWEKIPRLFTCMPRWMMVSFTEKENTEGKSLEITLFWTMTLISLGIRNWNCTKNNEKHNSIGWRYKLNNHRSVQSLSCVWLFVTP